MATNFIVRETPGTGAPKPLRKGLFANCCRLPAPLNNRQLAFGGHQPLFALVNRLRRSTAASQPSTTRNQPPTCAAVYNTI